MSDSAPHLVTARHTPLALARAITAVQARPIAWCGPIPPWASFYNPLLAWEGTRLSALADIAMMIAGVILWTIIVHLTALLFTEFDPENPNPNLNLTVTLLSGAGWVAVVAVIIRIRRHGLSSLGLTTLKLHLNILWGLVAIPATYGAHLLAIALLLALWPDVMARLNQNAENLTEQLPDLPPAGYLLIMMAVAFYEELVFRGFLMTRLRRLTGTWWVAVPLSSALFALPHIGMQEPAVLLPLFCIACVFGLFTVWRKSLIPAIIGHWAFNSFNIIALHYLQHFQTTTP